MDIARVQVPESGVDFGVARLGVPVSGLVWTRGAVRFGVPVSRSRQWSNKCGVPWSRRVYIGYSESSGTRVRCGQWSSKLRCTLVWTGMDNRSSAFWCTRVEG